ncbi:MAG TPA: hypothetical protein VMV63_09235 [Acidithiobacillus sp.]|nr:hypothetical protein [Acidithiobacillus sp.]
MNRRGFFNTLAAVAAGGAAAKAAKGITIGKECVDIGNCSPGTIQMAESIEATKATNIGGEIARALRAQGALR